MESKSLKTKLSYDLVTQRSLKNLGTFANTVMTDKAVELYTQFCGINAVDFHAYPELVRVLHECQDFLLEMTHGQSDQYGALSTSGSSEAIILSLFFMKQAWALQSHQHAPNILIPEHSHIAWHKAATLLDVEIRLIPTAVGQLAFDGSMLEQLVNEHTIGIVCTLGTTTTLCFDDVKSVNAKLKSHHKKTGQYIPIHVDAASGGFVAPFYYPKLKWDFSLEHVSFINISSHKYGLVYPALAWLLYKDHYCTKALSHENSYLGYTMSRTQLQFSHSAGPLVAQHHYLQTLGEQGYRDIMKQLYQRRECLLEVLKRSFDVLFDPKDITLPGVIISGGPLDYTKEQLSKQGWHLPTYTINHQNQTMPVGRIVLRHGMSDDLFESLLSDLSQAAD